MNDPILINCDIGERGASHSLEHELMHHIDIANIACGGHAGDRESIAVFRRLAKEKGVQVSAHLSYPDRRGFGRRSLEILPEQLLRSLSRQRSLMADVPVVKFHGALYNESCRNEELAVLLASWLSTEKIDKVLAPERSHLALACRKAGIAVLAEGFCERRYRCDPDDEGLELVSRSADYACITEIEEAVEQARSMIRDRRVTAVVESAVEGLKRRWVPIHVQTVCIHSDSPISLELARRLRELES